MRSGFAPRPPPFNRLVGVELAPQVRAQTYKAGWHVEHLAYAAEEAITIRSKNEDAAFSESLPRAIAIRETKRLLYASLGE